MGWSQSERHDERTAVLGGTGFLGVHVLAALVSRGIPAASVSRTPDRFGDDGPRLARLDARQPGAATGVLEALAPRVVVNCAALSRAADCDADPGLAHRLNAELPAELAAWCARSGARFVHVSTDLVFGGGEPAAERYLEDDPVAPLHVYGETKAAGEAAVQAASPGALVVRLPLLFGDSRGRGLGASDALHAAIAGGEVPALFTDEWRTPLDVAWAAELLVALLEARATGLVHLAGADRLSRHELGCKLLVREGRDPEDARRAVRAATRAEAGLAKTRARDVSLDAARAKALLERRMPGVLDPPPLGR